MVFSFTTAGNLTYDMITNKFTKKRQLYTAHTFCTYWNKKRTKSIFTTFFGKRGKNKLGILERRFEASNAIRYHNYRWQHKIMDNLAYK